MRIVVPIKTVPDPGEEIELTADQTGIDREFLKFGISEWDAQALEEALLIKDVTGAEVVAVGLAGDPDIDQELYTALAKGADLAVRIVVPSDDRPAELGPRAGERGALLAAYLTGESADLVLTGVQAVNDIDGQLPPLLAARLGQPQVSVAIGVEAAGSGELAVLVRQEFAGGRTHQLSVALSAVIGVQTARQAPRYAPVSRARQAMAAGGLRDVEVAGAAAAGPAPVVRRVYLPERSGQAQMLTGSAAEVAGAIAALLRDRGLVKGAAR